MTRAVHIFAARLLRSKSSCGMSSWSGAVARRKEEGAVDNNALQYDGRQSRKVLLYE
jgi:hypothetical protein